MKHLAKFFLFAAFLFVPATILAQGSGSTESPASVNKPKSGKSRAEKNNFAVTRSVNGTVDSIGSNSIVLTSSNGKNVSLRLTKNTRFVGGRPKSGQKVRVNYTAANNTATIVRRRG
jgi:hypothetical protein